MGPRSIAGNRLGLIVRAALLLAGLSTYLISPDDVVWRFIRTAPHARALEHALFGIAAAILGFALFLKVKASAHPENRDSHGPSRNTAVIGSILQAIGIGSLLPLPGFLLLVLGDVVASLLLYATGNSSSLFGRCFSSPVFVMVLLVLSFLFLQPYRLCRTPRALDMRTRVVPPARTFLMRSDLRIRSARPWDWSQLCRSSLLIPIASGGH